MEDQEKTEPDESDKEEQPEGESTVPIVDGPGGEEAGGTEGHGSSSYDRPGG